MSEALVLSGNGMVLQVLDRAIVRMPKLDCVCEGCRMSLLESVERMPSESDVGWYT